MLGASDCHPDVTDWVCPLERVAVPVACVVTPILIGLVIATLTDEVVADGAAAGGLPPQLAVADTRTTIRHRR